MSDIQIVFQNPLDGSRLQATMDNTMTAHEAIAELISNNFVKTSSQGYKLVPKGKKELDDVQTFADANVQSGETVTVVPQTDAGFANRR